MSAFRMKDSEAQVCFECGKSFDSGRKLAAHMKNHEEPKFKCEYCTDQHVAFLTKARLLSHQWSKHAVIQPMP